MLLLHWAAFSLNRENNVLLIFSDVMSQIAGGAGMHPGGISHPQRMMGASSGQLGGMQMRPVGPRMSQAGMKNS